jgi:hypothetical protein
LNLVGGKFPRCFSIAAAKTPTAHMGTAETLFINAISNPKATTPQEIQRDIADDREW